MFVFDVFYGRVGLPNLLSLVKVIAPRYRIQDGDHEPLNVAARRFNEVAGLFDFHLSRNQFFKLPEVSVVTSSNPFLFAG
jgi:hypothetical protein